MQEGMEKGSDPMRTFRMEEILHWKAILWMCAGIWMACTLFLADTAQASLNNLLSCAKPWDMDWQGPETTEALPVFSAPFSDAYQGAYGEAALRAAVPFQVWGASQGYGWLLVSYTADDASQCFGWITMPENMEETPECLSDYFAREPFRMVRSSVLTDAPLASGRTLRILEEGETVIAMMYLPNAEKNWAYVETEIDGRTAWGFTEYEALEPLSVYCIEGDRLLVAEGVTCLGTSFDYDSETDDEEYDDADEAIEEEKPRPEIEKGELWTTGIYLEDVDSEKIRHVILPSSLKKLGNEALCNLSLDDLYLTGHISYVSSLALYGVTVRRMIVGRDCQFDMVPKSYHLRVDAWDVEEGNPWYKSVDGVLLSRDGTTLLVYPNGRKQGHYDVPSGVEVIHAYAFEDNDMGLPLQTISLPIGLRRIEAGAFAGCGRLHSLTVPLTVTELAPSAFMYCVSLERLSLPPGLHAVISDEVVQPDFLYYTGDNGETERTYENFHAIPVTDVAYEAWLSGDNGREPVPVYASLDAVNAEETLVSGKRVIVSEVKNNRALIRKIGKWVSLDCLHPICEEVFFEVAEVLPEETGWDMLREKGLTDFWDSFFNEASMTAEFWKEEENGTEWSYKDLELPVDDVRVFRVSTGDIRQFAFLRADEPLAPIYLYDAPGGTIAAWTYQGDQAEILEAENGWARIRIAGSAGWITEDHIVNVEELPR